MKKRLIILFTLINLYACNGQNETRNKMDNNLTSVKGIVNKIESVGNKSYTAILSNSSLGFSPFEVLIDSINLKYPASFTIFKKGEEVVVLGNWTSSDKMTVREFKFIKAKEEFEKTCTNSLSKDSVRIENIVEFYNYEDTPSIRFTLQVTNLTNKFIPALNPHNNSFLLNKKTSENVTEFYFNGESKGVSIYNGISQGYETLNKGGVSKTSESYLLTVDSGIYLNGNIITVQWKYMGVLSEKVTINLKKQVIIDKTSIEQAKFEKLWPKIKNTTWLESDSWAGIHYVFYEDANGNKQYLMQILGSGVVVAGNILYSLDDFPHLDVFKKFRITDTGKVTGSNTLVLYKDKAVVLKRLGGFFDIEKIKKDPSIIEGIHK